MKSPAWIWQFNTCYPPAGSSFTHQGASIPLIGPNDLEAPICDAYVKSHDGLYWMSGLYSHPLAPNSERLAKLRQIYYDQGIELTPWCVPKGHWPVEEALIANRVLEVTNRLILDIEPYAYFWTAPFENLHAYMQRIRQAHPNAWIGLSFDPRYGNYHGVQVDKYRDIHFEEWIPYVDALLPQDYWETFQVNPEWEIDHTTARIADYGLEIIHAIPGHASSDSFRRAVETILRYGNRFSIWRRGTYATYNAEYVDSIQTAPTPPPPDCSALEAEVARLIGETATLKATLQQTGDESLRRLSRIRQYENKLKAGAQAMRNTANALEVDIPYVSGS